MAKKGKESRRAAKSRQWETEKKAIDNFRAKAPALKAALRARGCNLPFFEFLDSYEEEFSAITRAATTRFPSLVGAFEVDAADYASDEFRPQEVAGDWEQLFFNIDDPLAQTYNDRDPDASISGSTAAYLDPTGTLRSVVLIRRQVKCRQEHSEHKYHFKLVALCQELGHVDDLEKRINFDIGARKADIIEAEVYAHLFALEELNRRALYTVADTLEATLRGYGDAADHRGEISRRVLERYQRPERTPWQEYNL